MLSQTVQRYIHDNLAYDSEQGVLVYVKAQFKEGREIPAGSRAGVIKRDLGRVITIHDQEYSCALIVWWLHTNEWIKVIVPKNGDISSTDIGNLELPSVATKTKGISFHAQSGRWRVYLSTNGRPQEYIGVAESEEEAKAMLQKARQTKYSRVK